MKKAFIKITTVVLSLGLLVSACSKKNDSSNSANPDETSQQTTTANDESDVSSESDEPVNDANTVMNGSSSNGRVAGNAAVIINASIDTSGWNTGIYVITYHGNNANSSRHRTGTITFHRTGNKWSEPGSMMTITFNDYKVTRLPSGKTYTLNGTLTVANVSTGTYNYWDLPSGSSIEHKVRGSLTITFDNNTQRVWHIARHRKVTNQGASYYTLALSGDTTVHGYSNIETWGVNRAGENFYGQITSDIVFSTNCGFDATAGVFIHQGIARKLTVTYGVNSDGSVDTNTGTCPYGYKLDWVNASGTSKEVVKAY